eukprot:CAMPEP_0205806092 /NCGR_PEP_ID=MMETSP0205-20121125/9517_1 /ASSEMBLY_ACC=CAM_ASM_000278 /TAXON_ID=36767 /ORGANISM="Euplotes focardii, Strain TN1" /LENGTH=103 /DNA_ID=CAMNT_0053078367 /DNA_START=730 /DNA_END=1038 /DNA_ORIENTATION=-
MIKRHLPDLSDHFTEIGLDPQMFTTEWVLDLFSHTIPLNLYGKFLDTFIFDGSDVKHNYGWDYFYGVIICILICIQKELMQRAEWDEVLLYIKSYIKEKDSFF